MTEHSSSPLDPEIVDLLRRAEAYPDGPPEVLARVRDAVRLRVAQSAAGDSGHDAPVDDVYGADPPQAPSTDAARLFSLATRPARTLLATFIVGTAVGASLHAAFREPGQRIVYVERPYAAPVRPTTETPASVPPNTPPASAAPANEPPPPSRAPSVTKNPGSTSDLDAEQQLLDTARRALTRGRATEALAPLQRHARQFPKGILTEEREALAINVLVALERYDEARNRSARFLERYPSSLLRSSVEAAISAIP